MGTNQSVCGPIETNLPDLVRGIMNEVKVQTGYDYEAENELGPLVFTTTTVKLQYSPYPAKVDVSFKTKDGKALPFIHSYHLFYYWYPVLQRACYNYNTLCQEALTNPIIYVAVNTVQSQGIILKCYTYNPVGTPDVIIPPVQNPVDNVNPAEVRKYKIGSIAGGAISQIKNYAINKRN